MKLGMNTVILGGAELEGALELVARCGFEFVELSAIAGMKAHLNPGDDAAKIRDALAKNNLTATATEAATLDRERLSGIFKTAAEVGIPIVNIGSGGASGDEESTKTAISLMRELAKEASDAGVTLAVKPHVGQAIYNGATGARLMDEIAGDVATGAVGLNFDPSHLARADEDPAQIAPLWGSRIVTSHFRDCPVRVPGPPGTPLQQIPGRGALDLPQILRALNGTGYAGPLNLEIIGAHEWPLEHSVALVAESRGYLNRCLQEIEGN
jgi:sugar phosphate isomerase/epimerase